MVSEVKILVLNVGSTSTKVAVYNGAKLLYQDELPFHKSMSLEEQLPLREEQVYAFLREKGVQPESIKAIVSRGGLIKPLPAGIYRINEKMCDDILNGRYGFHASGLGPVIALDMSRSLKVPAITMDPPSTDEFHDLARLSGLPGVERISGLHALSQKAAARNAAKELGKSYEEGNFVVAHLGGGITVGAHLKGRVVDSSHGLNEGPYTPERAGGLPTFPLLTLYESVPDKKELQRRMVGEGGLVAYLGTKDAREIERRIQAGDRQARLVYEGMAYQVAKEIGAMATVLHGRVDGVVLTGGLSRSALLVGWIKERVSFIGPVLVFPDNEMEALAAGALRFLAGEEEARAYE